MSAHQPQIPSNKNVRKKKKRKCAQTKTQERGNLSGVFQVVALTQAAEQ